MAIISRIRIMDLIKDIIRIIRTICRLRTKIILADHIINIMEDSSSHMDKAMINHFKEITISMVDKCNFKIIKCHHIKTKWSNNHLQT